MKFIKTLFAVAAAFVLSSAYAAPGKPVGVWSGLASPRLEELVKATVFSPQWHKDKPLTVKFTGKEFDKVSAVVYIHGFNQIFRFREWKKDMIKNMEKFVSDGGVLIVLVDGAPRPPAVTKVGDMSKLLGATKFADSSDKVVIKDKAWQECGKLPHVFHHMLAPKTTQVMPAPIAPAAPVAKPKPMLVTKDSGEATEAAAPVTEAKPASAAKPKQPVKPLIALSGLTTAKPIIGDDKTAIVTVNQLGKGKVYFVNVRLTESAPSFPLPGHYVVNAEWKQYLPFAKKIHEALLEARPALSKEKREMWNPIPLGPKAKPLVIKKRAPQPVVSARKVQKLSGAPLPLIVNGAPRALLVEGGTGAKGTPGAYAILNRLLKKMSGTALPLPAPRAVREKDGKWVWRGKTYDTKVVFKAADHVGIEASGNVITISTPANDPALGIYTFMRECLGYRMLWPGEDGEVYQKSANISIEPIKLYDKSPMKFRSFRNTLTCGLYDWKMPDGKVIKVHARPNLSQGCDIMGLDVREAVKLRQLHNTWVAPQRLGGSLKEAGGTNFYDWGKRFEKSNPEFLALQFETFRKVKDRHPRICKSNPKAIKQAVQDILKRVRPDTEYCRFSPSDGGYDLMCMCENCRKWDCSDAPRGASRVYLGRNRPVYQYVSMTDRVLRFTCEAGKELRKHKPNLKVVYLAYAGYLAPPKYYHDFPDNMLVNFVGGEFLNPRNRAKDLEYWKYWSGVAKELCWRPNFLGANSVCGFPLIYVHALDKDLKYFASTGMVGGDFDAMPHHYATQALNFYVLAQLMWDPAANVDDLIDDFCKSGFGAGAEDMKKFYAHCEKLTDIFAQRGGVSVKEQEDLTNIRNLSARQKFVRIFNNREMDILDGYLKAAKAKVAANSPEAKRIEFVAAGMEYCRKMSDFWQKYWDTPAKERKKLVKDIDALVAYWQKLFHEKPFAIAIPGQVYSNYTGFFRNCGWKPIHEYKK